MATRKKAAKKAVPKVEASQIVLTQEQWNELNDLRFNFNSIMWNLDDTFNTEKSLGQVAFEIGKTYSKISDYHSKLDKLVDDTDPDQTDYWADFQGDRNDN
jgi:hypothetical protein